MSRSRGKPPPFRDPTLHFVNRNEEKRSIQDFFAERTGTSKRCLVLSTRRDVGVTFFLRHLEHETQRVNPKTFAVYVDCGSSDPEVIFRKFFDRLEDRKMLRWKALSILRELGDGLMRIIALVLSATWGPSIGPIAGVIVPKVATTAYASTPSERFARLIRSKRWKRPVLFLVDNAQEIKPQSLNILNTVYSERYEHVRFVLSFVASSENRVALDAFDQRLRSYGLGVDTMDFPAPDEKFVSQIASALRVPLADAESGKLLRATEGSISRIIAVLRREDLSPSPPSVLEQEILRYLLVAGQPLRRDDILGLVLKSPRLTEPEPAVQKALDALDRMKLIVIRSHWLGDEVEIAPGQDRAARQTVPGFADLVAAQELYAHFKTVEEIRSPRHSQSAYGALLYRLAKQVDPASVSHRAFDLVRISLAQADLAAAEHYVKRATGGSTPTSVPDLYTLLAFYVSVQDFQRALETLDALGPEYWQRVRVLRIIHAITLNRVRAHAAAEGEIQVLLSERETTPEEFALLTSYLVSGLLHDGKLGRARAVFERSRPRLRLARNRGYALRNCAAVYFWGDGRNAARAAAILAEAAGVFAQQQDDFGRYTTLNNRGALIGTSRPPAQSAASALPAFQKAFESLAQFGTQHVEEVGANLGSALLLTRQVKKATAHLTKMIAISSFDFPRSIMESALAFAEVMSGNAEAARVRMSEVTRRVADVHLPEAAYRANVNAAAVEKACGAGDSRFDHYVDAARNAGFWAGTGSLDRMLAGARDSAITRDSLPDFLSYDYFQYWSQNPLSYLAAPVLPEKAVRDHMAQ